MTGFINVDKACGVSSAREVAVIKRLTGTPCGHLGTLDPMASGVLPVAVGNAARLFDYFLKKTKVYEATFVFGVDYDTLDVTGQLLSDGGYIPTEEELRAVSERFKGEIDQLPPKYSAKNINGRRAYELARKGESFELPPKKVNINYVRYTGKRDNGFSFEISCGGGTYIRSIARDMASLLGTTAAMSGLRRTQSGAFTLENAVKTQDLTEDNVEKYLIPTDSVLPYESYRADALSAKRLFNGLGARTELPDGNYKIYDENNRFYGVGAVKDGIIKVGIKLC